MTLSHTSLSMRFLARMIPITAAASLVACSGDQPTQPGNLPLASVALTLDGSALLTSLGDTARVQAVVRDVSGATVAGARLQWRVEPAGIVEPTIDGRYVAVRNGRVHIISALDLTATGVRPSGYWADRTADTIALEVQQRAARLTLLPVDTAFTMLGATRTLQVAMADARGNPMDGPLPTLVWRSAASAVVTVDSTGRVRSASDGIAQVTVEGAGLSGSATFTVSASRPHTSCMSWSRRRQAREACVTLGFTLRAPGASR